MAWTSADLDSFDAQLKTRGTVTGFTSLSGESVSFSSLEDAMKFRAWLAGLVEAASPSSPPKNIRYAVTDKGA